SSWALVTERHSSIFMLSPSPVTPHHVLATTTKPIFFFTESCTTEIYTLSLHDALPILPRAHSMRLPSALGSGSVKYIQSCSRFSDRKSTRLNSSHVAISYAVFCLKKKTPYDQTAKLQACYLAVANAFANFGTFGLR